MAHALRTTLVAAAAAASAGGVQAAEPLLLCTSKIPGPGGATISASAFVKGDQIELTRASVDVTVLRLAPPRPLPMTGLSFSYDVRAATPLSLAVDSISLRYNGGQALRACGPGLAIVEADGVEVHREPFRARRGMCAPSVILERAETSMSQAMDRLLAARTITVRFVSESGGPVAGDTFNGLAPDARNQMLAAAFAPLVGGAGASPTCREFKSEAFEGLFPFRWVARTTGP